MPTTRKKQIKTVYKDELSDDESGAGDFSASESDAHISDISDHSSSEEDEENAALSEEEFKSTSLKIKGKTPVRKKKTKFAKEFIGKITKQSFHDEDVDVAPVLFSVKDLTDSDKLLPSVLNLSESDSSDDEHIPKKSTKNIPSSSKLATVASESENEGGVEYRDVWSNNLQEDSEEIAKKAFMELEKHKSKVEETKAHLQNYVPKEVTNKQSMVNVQDLLALGEEVSPQKSPLKKKTKPWRAKGESDSEIEDWEEVIESKSNIPSQGLQLVVALPDSVSRKTKKIDVEMMMKRKINRVKKEYQVYMHKVHVLCWLGHGNYISSILNDQEIMAAALAMVPKGCYPEDRLNMKYIEDITKWYKDKITIKVDKNENKFRPKAPPLKTLLLDQIKTRVVTGKKYAVFIFVSMLRSLGLQCRVMFNFVTLSIKPPISELCSLSTKPTEEKAKTTKGEDNKQKKSTSKTDLNKSNTTKMKIPQLDGNFDECSSSDDEFENIIQVDGNDDTLAAKTRSTRSCRVKKLEVENDKHNEDVSPPKRTRKGISPAKKVEEKASIKNNEDVSPPNRTRKGASPAKNVEVKASNKHNEDISRPKRTRKGTSPAKNVEEKASNKHNEDISPPKRTRKGTSPAKNVEEKASNKHNEDISSPKRTRKGTSPAKNVEEKASKSTRQKKVATETNVQNTTTNKDTKKETSKSPQKNKSESDTLKTKSPSLSLKKSEIDSSKNSTDDIVSEPSISTRKTRSNKNATNSLTTAAPKQQNTKRLNLPSISVTDEKNQSTVAVESKYFSPPKENDKPKPSRKRANTTIVNKSQETVAKQATKPKTRTKSAPGSPEKSKYFNNTESDNMKPKLKTQKDTDEDKQRVSHKDLIQKKAKPKNDVTEDLVGIIKGRIKDAKQEAKRKIVKGKTKQDSDENSDYLSEEEIKSGKYDSDEDFKPTKISPKPKYQPNSKPSTSKKIDRRVLSTDDEAAKVADKVNVWCEIYVEELEQWISVDIVNGKIHCNEYIYSHCTHPVCYIVGWDNNNYLKDLTRRYVPHWNTVTRKQRAEPEWWKVAIQPWLGPKTARDKEEDEQLDRMQLEAPLPKSIAEYKNHPLYALRRHLLKFEAIYPPDAATLGFVRGEAVYARECVYTCQSRDKWLKEAKVVKLGENPYKIVKARPKWDRLSNKLITDKPLEVFGPWQVQDYEPPVAENGIVPRNAYGNVELFKDCMLPKGTAHIKLPGLNKVCKKLNIDCAPAMTGFDFNGGWSHPVYDGFVVCKEFEEVVTEAWVKDQEDQVRREREKIETRVYGNWKRLIKGLLIRERLKLKYGFEEPTTSQNKKDKSKGPRLVVKKK